MTSALRIGSPSRAAPPPSRRRPLSGRTVLLIAVALIGAQLVLRGWVAASGFFYWDDFILIGEVSRHPLWSAEQLASSHDGHVMPLAFVLTWVVTAIAPLEWGVAAAVLVGVQLLASLAMLRLLVVLLGCRARLLGPLIFFLFVPLTVPAFAWWSAAVNALPLQIALAWVSADAVLLARTGRRRYAVSGAAVLAAALLFFEKAVVVLPVAVAVVALLAYVTGERVWVAVRRAAVLWAAAGAVLLAWSAFFLLVIARPRGLSRPEHSTALLRQALSDGLVPTMAGGPWRWERWQPATPWADPPVAAVAVSWVALILFAAWMIRTRPRTGAVLACLTAYAVLTIAPVVVLRDGPGTAALLLRSIRYFADLAVLAAIALALFPLAARRGKSAAPVPRSPVHTVPTDDNGRRHAVERTAAFDGARTHPVPCADRIDGGRATLAVDGAGRASRLGTATTILACAIFLAGSVYSTITFTHAWEPSPARTYVTGVRAALPAADAPLLPQEVPWNVLNPLAFPQNMTDHVFAPLAGPQTFARWTPRLRMFTDDGALVDAQVWWNRAIVPGPAPGCGYRVPNGSAVRLPLDGPMQTREWTAQLNYLSDRDATIAVSFEGGAETVAEVRAGLHTVFLRMLGGGSALRVRALTPGVDLCVGTGPVGIVSHS
ncbi:hypothetical protein [Nocardia rhizosphaerae]|uniref:Transmembrane protein n=1 Tax=Nocardia rhizosphaerae TaxID=1691571 RepID=A0ABV8KZ39_9NOCA